jgi:hypothetical protein
MDTPLSAIVTLIGAVILVVALVFTFNSSFFVTTQSTTILQNSGGIIIVSNGLEITIPEQDNPEQENITTTTTNEDTTTITQDSTTQTSVITSEITSVIISTTQNTGGIEIGQQSIIWGRISPGGSSVKEILLTNTMQVPVSLSLATLNYVPSQAQQYLSVIWDYNGEPIQPSQQLSIYLQLNVSPDITEITNFSLQISITGATA